MNKNFKPEKTSQSVAKTTCYMCACRCGIDVHVKNNEVIHIEGNRDHPVNKGVLCAKGSSGIFQHKAASRLQKPLLREGERGEGKFKEISWEKALEIAVKWLKPLRKKSPEKLVFFTGRDQSQSFTGWWAQQFGTPNYAAHGGFCSVNMAAAGIYTIGGSFWEFGTPDWDQTKLLVLLGVAEDHDSNPIKIGLGKLKNRGGKIVAVNPVRTGYNAIADQWLGIKPGTDGLLILSLVHVLLQRKKIDLEYLQFFTNAPFLVSVSESSDDNGMFLRDKDGVPLVVDQKTSKLKQFTDKTVIPALTKAHKIGKKSYTSVFSLMIEKYLDEKYAPSNVADECGIPATTINGLADQIADVAFNQSISINQTWTDFRGKKRDRFVGRPVSFHAMRGISAHSNGFQTCRAIHILQIILGTIDVPGGFRYKPPYPKPSSAHPKPHFNFGKDRPLDGPHLGYIAGPEDLGYREDGSMARIDKAYTWENPMSAHGLMHTVISNCYNGDPYKIDTLFMYMANMAWNSSMNTEETIKKLTEKNSDTGDYVIPRIIYSDSYYSETVAYADLILPDTTYLERHDCISLLDRPIGEPDMVCDAIRWPVVQPDRDVRGFQDVLLDLGVKLQLPGMIKENGEALYGSYADYIQQHERRPGVGPLAGFRGEDQKSSGRGAPNDNQIECYKENGGFWSEEIPLEAQYYKPWNKSYQQWAVKMGLYDAEQPFVFQIYLEPLAKLQKTRDLPKHLKPKKELEKRISEKMDPLPIWWSNVDPEKAKSFPYSAITQRPAAMYHSWGSQNIWLRQIHGSNKLFVSEDIWAKHSFTDGDWAKVTSETSSITVPVALMRGQNKDTIWTWNAIGKRSGTWGLANDVDEAKKGFLLNHLISDLLPEKPDGYRWSNSDPITGQAAWYDLMVRIEKVDNKKELSLPQFPIIKSPIATGKKQVK